VVEEEEDNQEINALLRKHFQKKFKTKIKISLRYFKFLKNYLFSNLKND
jgi:hypothetical protein